MKNNRDAIRVLGIFSLILIFKLIKLKTNQLSNTFLETVLINLITGCFVSIVVAYIDYKNKIDEEIDYFCREMQTYYFYISEIEKCIKKYNDPKTCMPVIDGYLKTIGENAKKKKSKIKIYWIFLTLNKIKLQKDIDGLYEATFGIELAYISICLEMKKSKKAKELKNTINKFKEEIYKEKKVIDMVLTKKIKNKKIRNYWNLYLEEIKKGNL